MKKILFNLVVIIYVVIAIFVTVCLLTFNEYRISEFGNKSLIIISDEDEAIKYNKGDLLIVTKEKLKNAHKGDTVFFYESKSVKIAEIQEVKDFGEAGINYVIDGNYQVVEDDIIGTSNSIKVIPKAGQALQILESKWGFLFLIVFPSLIAFLREIYDLVLEITDKK